MSCELTKYSRVPFSDIGFLDNIQVLNSVVFSKSYGKENMNPCIDTIVYETPPKVINSTDIKELNKDIVLPLFCDRPEYNLRYLQERTSSIESPQTVTPVKPILSPIIYSSEKKKQFPISPILNVSTHKSTEQTPELKTTQLPAPKLKKDEPSKDVYDILQSSYVSEELSPEMFSEDETNQSTDLVINTTVGPEPQKDNPQDRKLLRRLHRAFHGVLPPPSITHCKLTIDNMLDAYYQNEEFMFTGVVDKDESLDNTAGSKNDSLSRVSMIDCNKTEATDYHWPKITELRYHGLHYNRSKVSEEIEHLCQKLGERYVSNETASSCTIWKIDAPTSAKKRQLLRKQQLICKSPGSRLSHLAKRRIAFSKENLCQSSVLPSLTTNKRQMVFNVKKTEGIVQRRISPRKRLFSASPHKKMISPRKRFKGSPRKQMKSPGKALRKTPGKTPRKTPRKTPKKTPRSTNKSVRRRLLSNYEETNYPGIPSVASSTSSTRSTLKRALFQSPESKGPVASTSREDRKRKRSECEDDFTPQCDKFARSFSTSDVQQNSQKILQRRNTEVFGGDFSDHHKKKMLWAISTALRTQKVGMSHPNFKTYAAALSQLCRRLLTDLLPGGTRIPGSVNERMSKLVHQHVYAIVKGGKTVDEIVEEVKTKPVSLVQKPKGYIPLENPQESLNPERLVSSKLQHIDRARIRKQISFDKFV